jgi:hypothetical protein
MHRLHSPAPAARRHLNGKNQGVSDASPYLFLYGGPNAHFFPFSARFACLSAPRQTAAHFLLALSIIDALCPRFCYNLEGI